MRVKAYKKVMENFPAAFQFYNFEKFPCTKDWLWGCRNYATSVALTSMVGYILGIGDRHGNNILLDPSTGEVVHIDFGMLFDHAALVLPVPEQVPFRLSPDFEAALGCQGKENGVFRETCVATVTALQEHDELLLALCEVFLYDPVAKWCHEQNTVCNVQAERAIMSMRDKLRLKDPVYLNELKDVPTFVEYLINRATDPNLLGTVFKGWSPWL